MNALTALATVVLAFAPHRVIVPYQGSGVISGVASGGSGPVTIWAKPRDAARSFRVGSVLPVDGAWRLRVSPRVTTRYEAVYAGAHADRVVYVSAGMRLSLTGRTLTVTVRPVPALGHLPVELLALRNNHWGQIATHQTTLQGVATFRRLPPARYFVQMDGGGLYAGAVSRPFAVRG